MNFANPNLLWLLALVPVLVWFYFAAWRRRLKLITEFVPNRLVKELTVGVSSRRQKIKMLLVTLAVTMVILALGRPRWGFKWDEATQRGLDIIVAIDASRSMLAEDLKPNRLERAKLAALDLMKLAKTDRIGLIAFAGTAFLQCPLTLDDNAFRQSVAALTPDIMPQGGTALAETIVVAMEAFENEKENHKILVLFTDGEDHQELVLEAAQEAEEAGLHIFTVGVGSPEGDLIPLGRQGGQTVYLKDRDGNVVKSRLNEALLQQLAGTAKGFYLNLSGAAAIETLYTQGLAPLPRGEVTSRLVRRYFERFYWPLLIAIVLLLVEMFLPANRRSRRRSTKAAKSAVAAVVAVSLLFGVESTTASPAAASPGAGMKAFQKGDYATALEIYEKLQKADPQDHRLLYNGGAAAYRSGEYDMALQKFSAAVASDDPEVQKQVWYNLGNTQYRIGQENGNQEKRLESWKTALKMYDQVLKLQDDEPNAKHNRDHVGQMVKVLEEQIKEEKEKGEDGDESGEESDEENDDSEGDKKDDQKEEDSDKNQEGEDENDEKKESEKDQQDGKENEKSEPKPDEKPEGEEQPKPQSGNSKDDEEKKEQQMAMQKILTLEQAEQLLDAQRSMERPLIFRRPDTDDVKNRRRPIVKTW